MRSTSARIYGNGRVLLSGREYSGELVAQEIRLPDGGHAGTLIVHKAAGTYWTGIGRPRAYSPTAYLVFRFDSIKAEPKPTHPHDVKVWLDSVEEIHELPVKTNKADRDRIAVRLLGRLIARLTSEGATR